MMAEEQERDPRLDRLYRDAGRDAPPARLDAAILAAAHREAGARPRPLSAALRRWRVPVSIAALVVLSVSLVTLVHEESGDPLPHVTPSGPMGPVPAPEQAPPVVPPPAQPESSRPSAAAPPARSAPARPAPRPFQAPPRLEERPASPPPAESAAEDRAERPPSAAMRRSAPAAAAGPAAAEMDSSKAMAKSAPLATAGKPKSPPWQGFEQEPPPKWLDRIVELRKLGDTAAADEMLAEFKRRFPGHPLPAERAGP